VDTIVRPPETDHPELAAAPRRRRWPWLGLFTFVAIVLVVGSIWIANYLPLIQGSFGFGTSRAGVRQFSVDAFDVRGQVHEVPVGREGAFRYRFSIRNDGPVSVTIESVGASDQGGSSSVSRHAVRVAPDAYRQPGSRYEPWHEFSLAPGDEAIIEMEMRYRGRCLGRGDALSWNSEPVTFSILGLPRHEDVMVGVEVRFGGTGECGKN
jgi:hypothetical protein